MGVSKGLSHFLLEEDAGVRVARSRNMDLRSGASHVFCAGVTDLLFVHNAVMAWDVLFCM